MVKILTFVPLLYPESKLKILLDIMLAFILIYFFICIPIEITFNNQLMFSINRYISLPFCLFLVFDYFVKMNTVYYEFGKAVTDRTLIFSKYLSKGFLIDGLSLLVILIALVNSFTL
jgi:hypothetical protein